MAMLDFPRLEARILKLQQVKQQLLDRLNATNAGHSAELSERLSAIEGTRLVVVRSPPLPKDYNCAEAMFVDGIFAQGTHAQVVQTIEELNSKYDPKRHRIYRRLDRNEVKLRERDAQFGTFTVVTPIYERRNTALAYLFVIREAKVYTGILDYSNGSFRTSLKTLEDFRKRPVWNGYEVTHPSRVASPETMFNAAREYVLAKRAAVSNKKK